MHKHAERISNALIIQAFCDAVGSPFEFKESPTTSQVLNFAKNKVTTRNITDDTQMTLFGFEAILRILAGHDEYASFANEYVKWYTTQTEKYNELIVADHPLLSEEMMWKVESPGNTCMLACYHLASGTKHNNNSYGCGSVMRLLPVCGLFDRFSLGYVKNIAAISCSTTHHHPKNIGASNKLIDAYWNVYNEKPIDNIVAANKITDIGLGWVADECVDMAIWAYSTSTSFSEMLVKAICHPGDSDSVAAVSGALWGMSMRPVDMEIDFVEKKFIEEYMRGWFNECSKFV